MKNVYLKGPLLSRSGYGEHARFIFRALQSRPDLYRLHVEPTNWGKSSWNLRPTEENTEILNAAKRVNEYVQKNGQTPMDVAIQVLIPNEWAPSQTIARHSIGVTAAIETDKASQKWIEHCNTVDSIVVPSEHAKKTLVEPEYTGVSEGQGFHISCKTPVEVISYPFRNTEKDDDFLKSIDFETDFNFLTIAQFGPRKNLIHTIKYFVEEFHDDENVGLVIKSHEINNSILDRKTLQTKLKSHLNNWPDRKCKVYLLHGDLTDEQISSLYVHPKIHAYFTITHGEGFGLPIFEAACNGLPVAAPAWSGHVDFLYAEVENEVSKKKKRKPLFTKIKFDMTEIPEDVVWENVLEKGTSWCDAEEKSSKKALRSMKEGYNKVKKDALFLQEYLREKLEEEKMFKAFVDHVEKTCPEGLGDIETWLEDFNSELDDSPSEKEVDQFLDQFTVIKHD